MKRKVKYKKFDRTLTVAPLGDYSQNVRKPKCTQVKMYLRGVKIYSSEIKTHPSGVKTYPLCICITSICVQINRNYVFIILKILNSALFWICLTWLKPMIQYSRTSLARTSLSRTYPYVKVFSRSWSHCSLFQYNSTSICRIYISKFIHTSNEFQSPITIVRTYSHIFTPK